MNDKKPGVPNAIFSFFNEVGIIHQLATRRFEAEMPFGLTLAQFSLLNHFLRLGGPWTLVRLAAAMQVSKPTMTGVVRTLSEKGFVVLKANPKDGRSKMVSITKAGERAHAEAIAAIAPYLAQLEDSLGAKLFQRQLKGLSEIRAWLDDHRGALK